MSKLFNSARLVILKSSVAELYEARSSERSPWADWMYQHHIFLVADEAARLAERFSADSEIVQAAALLHDIADAVMSRFDSDHASVTDKIANDLLTKAGFSIDEISTIVGDAIRFHSCRDGLVPRSLEGRVMATADAVIHITSDFYPHGLQSMREDGASNEELLTWALPKLERDFRDKILFPAVRNEVEVDYRRAKQFITTF